MYRTVEGLGVVKGVDFADYHNVEQYRGIPYGSISARFTQATLVTHWPDKQWDGSRYGPICPFPRMVIGGSIVQKPLPPQHAYDMDEYKCLNLNITCPKGAAPGNGYPVVVWVHGGGNVIGSGSSTEYNGKEFVNFAVGKGLPVVLVTINYRLGAFGFMASESIKDHNKSIGQEGVGNYGIRDQLLAYRWVKNHIQAFGGDSSRITANGESAGSIDTHIIMSSNLFATELPFTQAILQSGVAPLTVRSLAHQQHIYDKFLNHLQISDGGPEEKLQELREVSSTDLVKAYIALGAPISSWQATVDGHLLSTLPTFSGLESQKYDSSLKRLLIGDCVSEGLIFMMQVRGMSWKFEDLQALVLAHMGKDRGEQVLGAYDLSADQDQEQLSESLVRLLTDAEWSQPIESVARSFDGEVFYYHMAEGNPFDGPNKGKAHHAVDLLFNFLTYQQHLSQDLQDLAKSLVEHWLVFVHGGRPWTSYDQQNPAEGRIMFYGPGGSAKEEPASTKPTYQTLRLCETMQNEISNLAASIRGEKIIY